MKGRRKALQKPIMLSLNLSQSVEASTAVPAASIHGGAFGAKDLFRFGISGTVRNFQYITGFSPS